MFEINLASFVSRVVPITIVFEPEFAVDDGNVLQFLMLLLWQSHKTLPSKTARQEVVMGDIAAVMKHLLQCFIESLEANHDSTLTTTIVTLHESGNVDRLIEGSSRTGCFSEFIWGFSAIIMRDLTQRGRRAAQDPRVDVMAMSTNVEQEILVGNAAFRSITHVEYLALCSSSSCLANNNSTSSCRASNSFGSRQGFTERPQIRPPSTPWTGTTDGTSMFLCPRAPPLANNIHLAAYHFACIDWRYFDDKLLVNYSKC